MADDLKKKKGGKGLLYGLIGAISVTALVLCILNVSGCVGLQGPQGSKGETGEKGETGDKGATGDTGAKGETGDKGATGDKGEKGDTGESGTNGSSGATGPIGDSYYTNTILPSKGGYVEVNKLSAKKGEALTFTIHVDKDNGYQLEDLKVNNVSIISDYDLTLDNETYTYQTTMKENGYVIEAKFRDGTDTTNPFILYNIEQIKSKCDLTISKDYTYRYYKIADGITEIDVGANNLCINKFYGIFDGNGVTFKNIHNNLFNTLGYNFSSDNIILKNFKAEMAYSAYGLTSQFFSKNVTFDNVEITGLIDGTTNVGAFNQFGDNYAAYTSYNVNFINCKCDAKIIAKGASSAAVLIGHLCLYNGYTATINIDSATEAGIQNAKIYAKPDGGGNVTGYKYYGLQGYGGSSVVVKVNGETLTEPHATTTASNFTQKNPTKDSTGYKLLTASNASKIAGTLYAQLTSYNEDGSVLLGGIILDLSLLNIDEFTGGDSVKVFDLFNSVVLEKGLNNSGHPEYKIEDGVFYIYPNSNANYKTGNITIVTGEYSNDDELLSAGTLQLAYTDNEGNWSIN